MKFGFTEYILFLEEQFYKNKTLDFDKNLKPN